MELIKSKFFNFEKPLKSNGHDLCEYNGWNSLLVTKFVIKKQEILNHEQVNSYYPDLKEKQKIFVVTKGVLEMEHQGSQSLLREYDAVDFVSSSQKYEMKIKEDAVIFMISAKNLVNQSGKPVFFNFKKDIEIKDLWGGQCISRPYEGSGLTLVLFDLKPGFKFEDKGHKNEQITWLIFGKMDFYTDGKHKTLSIDNGVDIGPNHVHGGLSGGAMGFDAFFPKREETKYKN